jgi:hypothetical protein
MKYLLLLMVALIIFYLSGIALASGNYELTRSAVSGGGARMAGGKYSIEGTTGQAGAGQLASETYTVGGGFWGGGTGVMQNGNRRYLPLVRR